MNILESSKKKKIYLHYQKPTEQELVSPTNGIWVTRRQSKTHDSNNKFSHEKWKKGLSAEKMVTNDMLSQQMATCQQYFQLRKDPTVKAFFELLQGVLIRSCPCRNLTFFQQNHGHLQQIQKSLFQNVDAWKVPAEFLCFLLPHSNQNNYCTSLTLMSLVNYLAGFLKENSTYNEVQNWT